MSAQAWLLRLPWSLACFLLSLVQHGHAQSNTLTWVRLPSLPDALGFAGPFAGINGGALIVAGGANFPDAMPWDGGEKVWHNSVSILPKTNGHWLTGFRVAHTVAYGVSVSTPNGVLCAGGSDARQHLREVFLLQWRNGKIETHNLPLLPQPVANGCGALVGKTVYLAGGIERPDSTSALKTFWAIDLDSSEPMWRELQPWPGPGRMLAVAGASNNAFFLFSGVELSADGAGKPVRHYLKDAYCFTSGKGWKRIADLPRAAAAAPSPAMLRGGRMLIVSGDDGGLVDFEPKSAHPGFPKDVLAYDLLNGQWMQLGDSPLSRATTPTVEWNGMWVIPGGEMKPGRRTPEVWGLDSR